MLSSDDEQSIGSSSSSSSSGRFSTTSASSSSSGGSNQSTATAPTGPPKYKRRRRVYERIRAGGRYQALQTVPEGEILGDKYQWIGPKVIGLMAALLICIGGIKEATRAIRNLMQGDETHRHELSSARHRRRPPRFSGGALQFDENDEEYDAADRNVAFPEELRYLHNVDDPLLPNDRVLFWHVPRTGAATIKTIAAQCFGLLLAAENGAAAASDKLTIISDLEGGKYVNVDTSTREGIEHARAVDLANMRGLNLVASSYLYDAAENLFSEKFKGRCITMLRHPVERAASLFYYLSTHPNNIVTPAMTLEQYAASDRVERNWMTRFLSNSLDKEVTTEHLVLAMHVLERKCIVGMLNFKVESLRRFETYFGWTLDGESVNDCHAKLLDWDWPNKNKHVAVKEGTEAWRKLASVNDLDMKLYRHAEKVFRQQGIQLFGKNQ